VRADGQEQCTVQVNNKELNLINGDCVCWYFGGSVQWYLYLFIGRVTIFFVKGVCQRCDMHFLILFILPCVGTLHAGMVCQDMIV
jgi:hypothetical protein